MYIVLNYLKCPFTFFLCRMYVYLFILSTWCPLNSILCALPVCVLLRLKKKKAIPSSFSSDKTSKKVLKHHWRCSIYLSCSCFFSLPALICPKSTPFITFPRSCHAETECTFAVSLKPGVQTTTSQFSFSFLFTEHTPGISACPPKMVRTHTHCECCKGSEKVLHAYVKTPLILASVASCVDDLARMKGGDWVALFWLFVVSGTFSGRGIGAEFSSVVPESF